MMQTLISSLFLINYDPKSKNARALARRWEMFSRLLMQPFLAVASRGIKYEFTAEELRDDVTYVLASNHQSQWDTFVFLGAFTHVVANKLLPVRAMTKNAALTGGIQTWYLINMGCFPAKTHPKYGSGVEMAVSLLQNGQTVFIAPEGRRTLPGETTPRPGVMALANVENVQILPAHIQWWKRRGLKTFKLTFGKPFVAKDMSPEEIMAKIYALPLP